MWLSFRIRSAPPAVASALFALPPVALPPRQEAAPIPPALDKFTRGRALLARGDPEGAVPLLEAAAAEMSDVPLVHFTLGRALGAAGRFEEGVEPFQTAVTLEPEAANLRLGLAKVLDALERRDEARREYERVLEADPSLPDALLGLGRLHARAGRQEAVPLLRAAARARPNDARILAELALLEERGGNLAGATEAYKDMVRRFPDLAGPRGLLADVLHKQGRGDEAIQVVRDGLNRDRQSPLLYRSLGTLLDRDGRKREALAAYQEYLRLVPNAPDGARLSSRVAHLEKTLKS